MIVIAAALAAVAAQPDRPTSALERALVERTCEVLIAGRSVSESDREKCVDDQLARLREDLGANLARLSPAERQKLAAICSPLETAATREAYLDCVSNQLAPLRERLRRAKPAAAEPAAPAAETPAAETHPVETAAAAAPPPAAAPRSRWRLVGIGGGAMVALAVAAGLVFARKKLKPATHVCRSCGSVVADAGALCAACRHQAAEALRQAAAERAAEAAEAAKRQQEAAEAAAQQELRRQEDARQAALDQETRRREAEEAARRQTEEARPREAAAASASADPEAEAAFDPHAILGVAKDASAEAVRAAYGEAMTKYDPENVSHLSPEVQQHYREKREAAERAFQTLTGV